MAASKLHTLIGAIKDKATISTATAATDIAVLRATPHHPSSSPPSPRHLAALLEFGRSSRLSASALLRSLSARLASARNPSVALKSLLCLHHLLSRGSFILVGTLAASLRPSSGRRSPLNLSSFRDPSSLSLSSWVRWYAALIELLISTTAFRRGSDDVLADPDRLTSLLNADLIAEIDCMVRVAEAMGRRPDTATVEENGLVMEVVRVAEEERAGVERGILVRVQEVKERVDELGFADVVELACLFKRLEECRPKLSGEVREVRERVERREEMERSARVRREKVSESARLVDRVGVGPVIFGSSRWLNGT